MKDIEFNISEKDIVISSHNPGDLYYNSVWGKLLDADAYDNYLSIIVPKSAKDTFSTDSFIVNFKAGYYPNDNAIYVRLCYKDDSGYHQIVSAYALCTFGQSGGSATSIHPCQFPIINKDGYFTAHFIKGYSELNTYSCLIYSPDVDFNVIESVYQEGNMLTVCQPGNLYRYPRVGVAAHDYVNGIPQHSDLGKKILEQFELDEKNVEYADFDTTTGDVNLSISQMSSENELDLTDVDKLEKPTTNYLSVVSVVYELPVVYLYYDMIPTEGGSVVPHYSYSQVKKETLSDGTNRTSYITSGAEIKWNTDNNDGVVTALANNDQVDKTIKNVELTITLNGKTTKKTFEVKQRKRSYGITSTTYETPVVSLYYPKVPSEGGVVMPVFSYYQYQTNVLSNGNTEVIILTSGGTLSWNTENTDGRVEASKTINTSEATIKTVQLSVTMNGKTGMATFNVRQMACIGQKALLSTDYGIPQISLSYPVIPASGGTVEPTYSYSQTEVKTYSDGSVEQNTITDGANLVWNSKKPNGIVSATKNPNNKTRVIESVTLTVMLNGKTNSKTVSVRQAASAVEVDSIIYDNPVVELSYDAIPAEGGSVSPVYSYYQIKTTYYNNGTVKEERTIPQARLTWSTEDPNGVVTASSTSNTQETVVERVTLSVVISSNGKSGSATFDVKQKAFVPVDQTKIWYVGQVSTTRSGFAALSASELISASEAISTSVKTKEFNINNTVYFVMVPSGTYVAKAQFLMSGFLTEYTAGDVVNPDKFRCTHEEIVIGGVTYSIYGDRNSGFANSNTPASITIN